jgi:O-antigen ligase
MFKDHPLLGVGLNNFTVAMDEYGQVSGWTRFLQPVHNVYLLVAAETGLVGFIAFIGLLFIVFCSLIKKRNYLLLISMTQITLLCLFDHYFFTLQQTDLLFWLIVGLVFSTADKV